MLPMLPIFQRAMQFNAYCQSHLAVATKEISSIQKKKCQNLVTSSPCIYTIVWLGWLAKASQAGAALQPAGRRAAVRAGTSVSCIRYSVMRLVACSARALCPKLEPLLEHGEPCSPGLVSIQV